MTICLSVQYHLRHQLTTLHSKHTYADHIHTCFYSTCTYMHAHIHTASPAMRMATGSSPALFIGVDGSGLVLGETSSGPVSWQGDPSLLVPVSLFIPMLRSSLRKSLHPDPRWRVRIAGEPSDYGAASLEGLSHSG